jgi:hypothetical protein
MKIKSKVKGGAYPIQHNQTRAADERRTTMKIKTKVKAGFLPDPNAHG